jgi:hypothetical protein
MSGEMKLSLDFDVWSYSMAELHGIVLGMFAKGRVFEVLQITVSEMLGFIIEISQNYYDNPYHSYYHAVDVTAMVYYMLFDMHSIKYLTLLDLASLLIASLGHDLGHPALNNVYQVNAKTDLALRYQNQSVLENNSIAVLTDIMTRQSCLRNLKEPFLNEFLTSVRELILATDMQYHFDLLDRFSDLVEALPTIDDNCGNSANCVELECTIPATLAPVSTGQEHPCKGTITRNRSSSLSVLPDKEILTKQQRQVIVNVLLHAADISNTVRPWQNAKAWSELVVHEFFRQGDKEKQLCLPISPNMNREQSNQPQISIGFGDLVAEPFFTVLHEMYPAMATFLENIRTNRKHWENLLAKEDEKKVPPPPAPGTIRRVSVAAGTLIIPEKRPRRVIKSSDAKHNNRSPRSKSFHYRFSSSSVIPEALLSANSDRPLRSTPASPTSKNVTKTRRSSSVDHTNTVSVNKAFFSFQRTGSYDEDDENGFSDYSNSGSPYSDTQVSSDSFPSGSSQSFSSSDKHDSQECKSG